MFKHNVQRLIDYHCQVLSGFKHIVDAILDGFLDGNPFIERVRPKVLCRVDGIQQEVHCYYNHARNDEPNLNGFLRLCKARLNLNLSCDGSNATKI